MPRRRPPPISDQPCVFPQAQLSRDSFDGGKIQERRAIGFAGESTPVLRMGALFYWAEARAVQQALIDTHPHRVFEICSYVLSGELTHRDSAGHELTLQAGDLQVMQTGSGLEHSEEFSQVPAHMMQIWFEPDRRAAAKATPAYHVLRATSPKPMATGVLQRELIGGAGCPALSAPVTLSHWFFEPGAQLKLPLAAEYGLAGYVVGGAVQWGGRSAQAGDFVTTGLPVEVQSLSPVELILVSSPLDPGYPLFHKARPATIPTPAANASIKQNGDA